jgi:sigma-B regulation protein RsbU (phosphoserine phosphatase)
MEVAERATLAAQRMQTMIQDILDFARAAAGTTFPIRWRSVDLSAVTSMVVQEIKMVNPERSIFLVVPDELKVDCDPDRIAQALGNLLVNAVQHAEGPISVSLNVEAAHVVVRVHNEGAPIPEDAMPTLFDPFKKSNPETSGLGLGLHIVREILRAHGGAVTAQSSQADGTTFVATWPLNRPVRQALADVVGWRD